jgi:hypothetical protein
MTIGSGIAICGIWAGVGAMCFSGLHGIAMAIIGISAAVATYGIAEYG